jgi:hypothetical protein
MRRKFPTPCRRADQAATLRIVALGIPVPRQQRIQLIDLGASGHDALENISEIARRVDVGDLCFVHERRENGPSLGAAFAAGEQMGVADRARPIFFETFGGRAQSQRA